jgi:hypothetical protein
MYFGFFIVIKGYRNSSEKAVNYFIIKMGGIAVFHYYKNGWHCCFWLFAMSTIGISFFISIFILFFSESVFTPYVSLPVQYALSALLIGFFSWVFFYRAAGTKLRIYNDTLIVKHGVFNEKTYKRSDIIGVVNITRNTYLVTRLGAEWLAFRLPTEHSYAIHSWLMPYLKR